MWRLDPCIYCEMTTTSQLLNPGMISHHCPFYSDNLKEQIYYVYLSACAFPPLSPLLQRDTDDVFSRYFTGHVCWVSSPKGISSGCLGSFQLMHSFSISLPRVPLVLLMHAVHDGLWMRLSHRSPNSSAPHAAHGQQGEERSLASGDFSDGYLVILNCDLINGPPLCTNASFQSFNMPPAIKEQKLPTSKMECFFFFPSFWTGYI